MTPEQQEHIDSIIFESNKLISEKYEKGAVEHGGNLWDKEGIIDMAIEEALDQITYLLTLKKQILNSGVKLGSVKDN